MQGAPHLWTAGQERLDINVGVVHFETVVPKSSGNPDGRQHTSLKEDETRFKNSKNRCGQKRGFVVTTVTPAATVAGRIQRRPNFRTILFSTDTADASKNGCWQRTGTWAD